MSADYDARVRAIRDATLLMHAMQAPFVPDGPTVTYLPNVREHPPLDRFEVVELARFLLGLDDEPLPEATS